MRPPKLRFRLHVLRSLAGGPDVYEPRGDEIILGAKGGISLPGERFCHPSEAIFRWQERRASSSRTSRAATASSLRVRRPVEVEPGDEFIVGDQLLRIEKNPVADDEPDSRSDLLLLVAQVGLGVPRRADLRGRRGRARASSRAARRSRSARAVGDLVFPNDPLVSEQHCYIEEQAGSIVLTDLQSRTGVFVRVKSEERLDHGDQIIVGRTRLAVDLSPSGAG